MCRFFSAIVLRNGDVKWHWATDSHADLITHFKLNDGDRHTRFWAKVEFVPPLDKAGNPDFADVEKYTLTVDEVSEPSWFDDLRERVIKQCHAIVNSMLIDSDSTPLVLDG